MWAAEGTWANLTSVIVGLNGGKGMVIGLDEVRGWWGSVGANGDRRTTIGSHRPAEGGQRPGVVRVPEGHSAYSPALQCRRNNTDQSRRDDDVGAGASVPAQRTNHDHRRSALKRLRVPASRHDLIHRVRVILPYSTA